MEGYLIKTYEVDTDWIAYFGLDNGLRARIRPRSEAKIIVGRILARYQYDLRGKTDPHFLNTEGRTLIASEANVRCVFASDAIRSRPPVLRKCGSVLLRRSYWYLARIPPTMIFVSALGRIRTRRPSPNQSISIRQKSPHEDRLAYSKQLG
ncbi:hypothetical protein BASA60_001936 [Batrachochytrium salamandrivorans]|nr:hypothetical protein BASA60_001936 [Batrachochytrium salamandrivorans]